jgi:hypothetical protein
MQRALSDAGVKPPDWPVKPKDAKKPPSGGPTWDVPTAGDLDDERAFDAVKPRDTDKPTRGTGAPGGPSWDTPKGGDLDDEIPF